METQEEFYRKVNMWFRYMVHYKIDNIIKIHNVELCIRMNLRYCPKIGQSRHLMFIMESQGRSKNGDA